MNTKDAIREYIIQEMLKGKSISKLWDDDQLVESGIIDSLGIMSLLSFVEETFAIQIQGEDLIPDNFESINSIAALVDRQLHH